MNNYADFAKAVERLLQKELDRNGSSTPSTKFGWSWTEHKNVPGYGYVTKTTRRVLHPEDRTDDSETELEELEGDDDAAYLTHSDGLTIQWHITFSRTYLVPMLMFQAWTEDGSVLSLTDIMKQRILQPASAGASEGIPSAGFLPLAKSEFPLVQQAEHPTTQQIMWSIHPCNVRQAVEVILPESERSPERWLETWLMLTSTLVDLS